MPQAGCAEPVLAHLRAAGLAAGPRHRGVGTDASRAGSRTARPARGALHGLAPRRSSLHRAVRRGDDASVVILSFLENTFRDQHPNSVPEIRTLVIEATLKRVRPMLMSTATTVIGLMPIFLTHGRGSDVMQPMAVPSVGGMGVQLITFLVAPCIYCMVKEWQFRHAGSSAPQIDSGS